MTTPEDLRRQADDARRTVDLIVSANRDFLAWHGRQHASLKARGMALAAAVQGADLLPVERVAEHAAELARDTRALDLALTGYRDWFRREIHIARRRVEAAELAAAGLDAADVALDLLARLAKTTKG